jgi:hypothetical protein
VKENMNEPTSEEPSNEDEVVQVQHNQTHNTLSKPIIRPWEEIICNKNRTGLGYDKEVTFRIPDYSRPIKFQSVGFLRENSTSPIQIQHQNDKCKHCNRIGHMENQCFDLHPANILESITILQTDVQR